MRRLRRYFFFFFRELGLSIAVIRWNVARGFLAGGVKLRDLVNERDDGKKEKERKTEARGLKGRAGKGGRQGRSGRR